MGRRRLVWGFYNPGLGRKQLAKFAQVREVFRDEFLVLDSNTQIGFQKCNQPNHGEGVNLERLVLIFYRGQRNALAIDVVFKFLRYLHDFSAVVFQTSQVLASLLLDGMVASYVLPELDDYRAPIHFSVVATGELGSHSAARSG